MATITSNLAVEIAQQIQELEQRHSLLKSQISAIRSIGKTLIDEPENGLKAIISELDKLEID